MAQSPDKTRIGLPQAIVETSGVVWSIRSDTMVLRATSLMAAPVVTNAKASEMVLAGGIVYAHSTTAPNHWWKVTKVQPNGTVSWADAGVNDPASSVIPPPPPAPTITGFAVTPPTVQAGQGVVLSATVANATSVTLDGVPITLPFTHKPTASRSYQIVATGAGGTVTSPLIAVSVAAVVVPPGASPDGTMVPPAASIITATGTWTFGANVAGHTDGLKDILLNGVVVDGGAILCLRDGVVYTKFRANWWRWNGTAFVDCGTGVDPTVPYAAPVKSFPPSLTVAVGRPISLLQYVSSALPLVFDPIDDADKSLTAAGVFTAKRVATGTVSSAVDDGHS